MIERRFKSSTTLVSFYPGINSSQAGRGLNVLAIALEAKINANPCVSAFIIRAIYSRCTSESSRVFFLFLVSRINPTLRLHRVPDPHDARHTLFRAATCSQPTCQSIFCQPRNCSQFSLLPSESIARLFFLISYNLFILSSLFSFHCVVHT